MRTIITIMLALLLIPVLLATPFIWSALNNNFRAMSLSHVLKSAELPKYAFAIESTSRVFNGGNGNGCDFQGIMVVSHYGKVADLQQSFRAALERYADPLAEARIQEVGGQAQASWTLKVINHATELSISPNTDTAGLYLVDLTIWARDESLDLRCS